MSSTENFQAFRTIASIQRHQGEDKKILKKRFEFYTQLRKNNPHRWSKEIKSWTWQDEVYLNRPAVA